MHIAVSGASGLVGSRLTPFLESRSHKVTRLVRRNAKSGEVMWNPAACTIDDDELAGVDGFVNLSGESIAEGRWNAAKKQRILTSRLDTTRLLAFTLAQLNPRPKVWISASAIGFYGDRGTELLSENSPVGEGYLADVCNQWEEATRPAADAGVRVVNLRIGLVLSKQGGALKKMLLPFQLGAGGIVGDGKQYWSFIGLSDLVESIHHCLVNDSVSGPVNAVTGAVTNHEFTKTLGKVLRRPTVMPLPAFAAKLVLGEMAPALLLASANVQPLKLKESGFDYKHPDLETSLRNA